MTIMSRRKAFGSLRILAESACSVRPCVAQQPPSLLTVALTSKSPAGAGVVCLHALRCHGA